jgi:hypothetical protein
MTDKSPSNGLTSEQKRGGYSGGRPAASMKPPAKLPSGAIRPAKSSSSSGK